MPEFLNKISLQVSFNFKPVRITWFLKRLLVYHRHTVHKSMTWKDDLENENENENESLLGPAVQQKHVK